MNALEEYKAKRSVGTRNMDRIGMFNCIFSADAAIADLEAENTELDIAAEQLNTTIAALEAEVEQLKVCGNCGSWYGGQGTCIGNCTSICRFLPSLWTERRTS